MPDQPPTIPEEAVEKMAEALWVYSVPHECPSWADIADANDPMADEMRAKAGTVLAYVLPHLPALPAEPGGEGPDGRPDCGYCRERLAVNVGLLTENRELRRRVLEGE